MITKYNKFKESKLIIEDGTGNTEFDKFFKKMTDDSTAALKDVNDKYFGVYSQDFVEIKDGQKYWGIFELTKPLTESVLFESSVQSGATQVQSGATHTSTTGTTTTGTTTQPIVHNLEGKSFWCQVTLGAPQVYNEITWFKYDLSFIGDKMTPEDSKYLNDNKNRIVLNQFGNNEKSDLLKTYIRGYYIFSKPYDLIPTIKKYFGVTVTDTQVYNLTK